MLCGAVNNLGDTRIFNYDRHSLMDMSPDCYLLIVNQNSDLVIYWPEVVYYENNASLQRKKNILIYIGIISVLFKPFWNITYSFN